MTTEKETTVWDSILGFIFLGALAYGGYCAFGFFFPSDEAKVLSLSYQQVMVFKDTDIIPIGGDIETYIDLAEDKSDKLVDAVEDKFNVDLSHSVGDALDSNDNISNVEVTYQGKDRGNAMYFVSYMNEETKKTAQFSVLLTEEEYPLDIVLNMTGSFGETMNFVQAYGLKDDIAVALARRIY